MSLTSLNDTIALAETAGIDPLALREQVRRLSEGQDFQWVMVGDTLPDALRDALGNPPTIEISSNGLSTDQRHMLLTAQAILLVVQATQLFSQPEREFLRALIEPIGSAVHLLVAVNDIRLVEEEDRLPLQQRAETILRPYLGDSPLDAYVFWVDVKQGIGLDTIQQRLAELEGQAVGESAALQTALGEMARAHHYLLAHEAELAAHLDAIQQAQAAVQAEARQQTALERQIAVIRDSMNFHLMEDLLRYADAIRGDWAREAGEYLHLDDIPTLQWVSEAMGQGNQTALPDELARRLQRYLEMKLNQWLPRVGPVLQEDFEQLAALLEEELEPVSLYFDRVPVLYGRRPAAESTALSLRRMQRGLMWGNDWVLPRWGTRAVILGLFFTTGGLVWRGLQLLLLAIEETVGATMEAAGTRQALSDHLRDGIIIALKHDLTTPTLTVYNVPDVRALARKVATDPSLFAEELRERLPANFTNLGEGELLATFNRALAEASLLEGVTAEATSPNKGFKPLADSLAPEIINRLALAQHYPTLVGQKLQDGLAVEVQRMLDKVLLVALPPESTPPPVQDDASVEIMADMEAGRTLQQTILQQVESLSGKPFSAEALAQVHQRRVRWLGGN